jgi:hypothetical protein
MAFEPHGRSQDIQAETVKRRAQMTIRRRSLAILAYVAPTFALGFVWHLVLFKQYYAALAMYRSDVILPFGLLAMLIQGFAFAWVYETTFARWGGRTSMRMLAYAGLGAALSWSFTTIAVAAKNVMTSVPDYLLIETAFTIVQWVMVAPLTTLIYLSGPSQRELGIA